MAGIVLVMLLIVAVALIALSRFISEDDDWSVSRPGRQDPDEGGLDDLLH